MNSFLASNGYRVITVSEESRATWLKVLNRNPDPDVNERHSLGKFSVEALREFFRAEEDERLGRWRWPENSEFAVYPSYLYKHPADADEVNVVNTSNGASHRVKRGDPPRLFGYFSEAGQAYFDAHPEPKPWHNAQPKEVWQFRTTDDRQYALGWVALDGTWDVIDPRGALIPNTADPIARLVENGYPKFATATAVRFVPEAS